MRRSIVVLTAALFMLPAAPGVAAAAPLESGAVVRIAPGTPAAGLVLIRDGCGYGYHRSPYGRCRPNMRPYRPAYHHHHFRRCVTRLTPYGWRRFCSYR